MRGSVRMGDDLGSTQIQEPGVFSGAAPARRPENEVFWVSGNGIGVPELLSQHGRNKVAQNLPGRPLVTEITERASTRRADSRQEGDGLCSYSSGSCSASPGLP